MKIIRIEPTVATLTPKKKVAAYARVSVESDRLNHSLSAQVSYYINLIQNNPEWIYVGVYADSGISGGGISRRAEFKRLLADCDVGRIDIVLCNIKLPYLIQSKIQSNFSISDGCIFKAIVGKVQ